MEKSSVGFVILTSALHPLQFLNFIILISLKLSILYLLQSFVKF